MTLEKDSESFSIIENAAISLSSPTKAAFSAQKILLTALSGQECAITGFKDSINLKKSDQIGGVEGKLIKPGFVAIYLVAPPGGEGARLIALPVKEVPISHLYTGKVLQPSIYTMSALVSVWPIDKDGNFLPGLQKDRSVYLKPIQAIKDITDAEIKDYKSCSLAAFVPHNAKTVGGYAITTDVKDTGGYRWYLAATNDGIGEQQVESAFVYSNPASRSVAPTISFSFKDLPLAEPQIFYYKASSTFVSTVKASLYISQYTI